MGDYSILKQAIADVIKTNGNEEITGAKLQNVLLTIINNVGENATFAGIITPSMNPGTPDANIFYIAVESGVYPNINSTSLNYGEVGIVSNKGGAWQMLVSGIASSEKVNGMYDEINGATQVATEINDWLVGKYISIVEQWNYNWIVNLGNYNSYAGAKVIVRDVKKGERYRLVTRTNPLGTVVPLSFSTLNSNIATVIFPDSNIFGSGYNAFVGEFVVPEDSIMVVQSYDYDGKLYKLNAGYGIYTRLTDVEERIETIEGKDMNIQQGKGGTLFTQSGYVSSLGNEIASTSYYRTEFLIIDKTRSVKVSGGDVRGLANLLSFFDKDKRYISGFAGVDTVEVQVEDIPENAYYIRASARYPKVATTIIEGVSLMGLAREMVRLRAEIPTNILTDEALNPLREQSKLIAGGYNIAKFYQLGYFHSEGGITSDTSGNYKYVMFPVKPGDEYVVYSEPVSSYCFFAFFTEPTTWFRRDSQKVGWQVVTIPDNCNYLGVTLQFGATDAENVDKVFIYNNKLLRSLDQKFEEVNNKPLRVLLIGSSFGMQSILQLPVLAKKSGFNIYAGNLYRGAITIEEVADYMENNTEFGKLRVNNGDGWTIQGTATVYNALQHAHWDYIIVQKAGHESWLWTDTQRNALQRVLTYLTNNVGYGTKILFNSGFAYPIGGNIVTDRQTQLEYTNNIIAAARQQNLEFGLPVIPMVTAIQEARNTDLTSYGTWEHHDLASDYEHLDYGIGCYIAGLTLLCYLFGCSPYSVQYMPQLSDISAYFGNADNFTPITATMREIAQKAVAVGLNNGIDKDFE